MDNTNNETIQHNINYQHQVTHPYQGIHPLTHATVEPIVDIATISNWRGDKSSEIITSINLTTYELSYNDFMACFYYKPGAAFSINASNLSFKPILLTGQTYLTTNNNQFSCDLYNLCIQAFCEKHSVSENTISAFKKIALAKETFRTQSLASISGTQVGLHWDMVVHNLQTNHKIIYTKDAEDFANVIFQIYYIHYSAILEVTVQFVFSYKTSIPYYRNVYNNDINKPPVLIPGYTNISHLLDAKMTNKKEKKTNINENDVGYHFLNNNVDGDCDNDSVLTKNIVYSEHDIKNKNISFFTEEEEEDDDDVQDVWRQ